MEGLDTVPEKFTFMSLDDAHALESVLTKDSRVLIIGAGLIGLKCAEGIKERVKSITVVDLADRVLPSILDETGSAIASSFLAKRKAGASSSTSAIPPQQGRHDRHTQKRSYGRF